MGLKHSHPASGTQALNLHGLFFNVTLRKMKDQKGSNWVIKNNTNCRNNENLQEKKKSIMEIKINKS